MNGRLALEAAAVALMAALLGALVPWSTGALLWSWDALNHHVYLGMLAEQPRWHLDVTAASGQSYQYPYLYWPAYRMSLMSGSGAVAGASWAGFQAAMLALPVWMISLRLLGPLDSGWKGTALRLAACMLAAANAVVLIGIETTASDALAAVPLLWAMVVALGAPSHRQAAGAAALWGVSVAFKLSNGLFLPLLLFWWWQRESPHLPLRRGLALAAGAALGFALAYAPWGWQLWQHTGNPMYPYFAHWLGGS
jgi:hypothetical protein